MKRFVPALLLICFSVFTVQAQHKSKQPVQQVVRIVIDVRPDGVKETREIYASGADKLSVTKVKPPKYNDVLHEERTYDFNTKTFVITNQLLANGKVIDKQLPPTKTK
jgi:hypothetical protein